MSRFVVLIYGDEAVWDGWSGAEATANGEAHGRFHASYGDHVVGGHELDRPRAGRTVRLGADGEQVVLPGPYLAGQGHVLGGFYVLEAADLDEAVEMARDLPEASAATSGVEVRPLASAE